MKPFRLTTRVLGPSNLFAALCRELQIAHYVNSLVEWDDKQWKTSPGTLITALIINILVHRQPLYLVEEFYRSMDLGMLFDESVAPDNFNDDALGRALDRLSTIDCKQLFQTIACRATIQDNMEVRSVHADTTSVSVYGQFLPTASDQAFAQGNLDKELINITYGYSKQHRPDLKQFICGLLVSSDGFPLVANVNDGNKSDKVWNKEVFEELETSFLDPQRIIYVADSALITRENLGVMADKKIRFVSRLPEVFSAASQVKEAAWDQGDWQYLGPLSSQKKAAKYWATTRICEIDDRPYRCIVVRSSALDKRREKSLQKRLRQELEQLDKAKAELETQEFNCEPDAKLMMNEFLHEYRKSYHGLAAKVIEYQVVKRKPGRPRKGEVPPTVTKYRVEITISEPSAEQLQLLREKESTFVLITTLPESDWSNYRVLKEYKDQSHVERRFRFLKHPLVVDGIFLKSTRRSEALAYVILIALLVAAFLERRIRTTLQDNNDTIEILGKRTTDNPTIEVILEMLRGILVIYVDNGQETARVWPDNVDPRVMKLLYLAGYDEQIYIETGYLFKT